MLSHGVPRSICVACIVGLLAMFSIALIVSPTSSPTAFYQVKKMNVCTHVKCVNDAERPYSKLTRTVDHGRTEDASRNRGMRLPLPLVQPSIINCRPAQSREVQDILGIHVIKTVGARVVCAESKRPGIRAPQPRVAKDPRNKHPVPPYTGRRYVRIKFARPREESLQTRVHAIRRGTSKSRRPPATIYPRDQDCRGHVEQIRRRASYLVRRKHNGSKDGWKCQNQGWFYRRWDDENLD